MAWYPGAIKMELQPESNAQAAIRPTQLIFHSIVGPWTPRRTYEYWRDSTNLESHFGVGYDGDIAQYIGTETRADANYRANRRPDGTGAVSVETASNTSASDPWTGAQIEEFIQLGVWMHKRHGVPLRICRSASDPGFGYHRLHSAWSPSGTACPGPARIKQFREVVFPGIVARATGQTTAQEDDVPHYLNVARKKPMKPAKGKMDAIEYDTEYYDPGRYHYSPGGSQIAHGRCQFTGSIDVRVKGLSEGETLQVRLSEVDRDSREYVKDHDPAPVIGTSGDSFGRIPLDGLMLDKGKGMRIRVEHFSDADIEVTAELKLHIWDR